MRNTNPQTPKTQTISVDGMRRNSEYTVSWHDGVCVLLRTHSGKKKNSGIEGEKYESKSNNRN